MWKTKQPDLIIGPRDAPQTLRWHLFRWRGIQVALHKWMRSDSDRALHDHSAGNVSILLTGCYFEVFSHAWQPKRVKLRRPFIPYYRGGALPHRVQLLNSWEPVHGFKEHPVWTLWIRFRPWREWGFWCTAKRWVHWTDYVDSRDSGLVGNGCG